MANTIKVKRGTDANRTGITPAEGELLYTTDTKKVYVGDGTTAGGNEVGGGGSQTPAELLADIKTVDGSGSGLDADLLDGQQGTYYAAASSLSNYLPLSGGTLTGELIVTGTSPQIKFNDTDAGDCWIHVNSNKFYILPDRDSSGGWETPYALELNWGNNTAQAFGNTIWTAGNDGSGSGLDADLLDGQQGTYYQPASTALTTSTSHSGDVTGTYNNLQIAANVVGANELNVSGNGTAGQVLQSDGDGSMTWATPSSGGVTTGKAIAMAMIFG
jgi:hypothetical protein